MPLIPDDKIAEIRERLDIVQIVGEHVQLRRAGVNHKGLCPFHAERSPSFNVNPARQIYCCFGCGEKGDVFSFLMKLESKNFMEVARELAKRAGVELPERERSPEELKAESERERFIKVNELAADYYRAVLMGDDSAGPDRGQAARAYLDERGIDADTAQKFRLGFAPDAWDSLALFLDAKKIPADYAIKVGLIAVRERGGGHYDKFRARLMCPIINLHGECVGFSGRVIDPNSPKETPKYVNSPESPVYTKGRLLFGAHQARDAWAKKRRAVVVEGNFDVITLHRHQAAETVCPLGTALTQDQVDVLKKRVEKVVLMLDGDSAGKKATLRSAELLIRAGVPTYVVRMALGEDPDSFARAQGIDAPPRLAGRIDGAQRAVKHFIDELPHLVDLDPVEAVEHARTVVPLIQAIPDPAAREMAAHQVQAATGVPYAKVLRWAEEAAAKEGRMEAAKKSQPSRQYNREEKLVGLIADHPQLRQRAFELGLDRLIRNEAVKKALEAARSAPDDKKVGMAMFDAAPELAELVVSGFYSKVELPENALVEAIQILRKITLQERLTRLANEVRMAERQGDPKYQELNRQRVELEKQLHNLVAEPAPVGQPQGT